MKLFVGTFCLGEELSQIPDVDFDVLKLDAKNYFIMGGDETSETISEIITLLEKEFGTILFHNISYEGEHEIEILQEEIEEGNYEGVTFEGPYVNFEEIYSRFSESDQVISIRENGISRRYNTPIVIVDFLY